MTKENPNDVIVESGNLSNLPDRVGLIASILSELGYDAVGVGETDMRTSGENFFKKAAENKLTVLDATPKAPESTRPYIIKDVGGVKVGIISFGFTPPSGDTDEYTRRKALYTAYKAARDGSDILIVLDQANLVTKDWIERNGARLGAPDIVIGGVFRQYLSKEEVDGKTWIVPTSMQGKNVGVVDVELAPGQEPKFTLQNIALEGNVAEDEAVAKRVKDFMAQIAQVQQAKYVPPQPVSPSAQTLAANPNAKPYYSPALCRTCHVEEYLDWKTTKHAHAISTLASQQPPRMIPECLKCHSEMFRTVERATTIAGGIGGVECATCHAGSLPHGIERQTVATRVKVDPKICVECHDKQWSPKYDEKAYMSRVSHAGVKNVAGVAGAAPAPPAPAAPTPSAPPPTVRPQPSVPAVGSRPPTPPALPPTSHTIR